MKSDYNKNWLPCVLANLVISALPSGPVMSQTPVGELLSNVQAPTGDYISWREHIVDDPIIAGFALSGSDGLVMADLDLDSDLDIMAGSYSRGSRLDDGDVDMRDPLGRLGWFENPGPAGANEPWQRHDISRRKRGMFDKFIARDLDADGDMDFVGTRGNSAPFDGVFWLEQVRSPSPRPRFTPARSEDSEVSVCPDFRLSRSRNT